MTLKIVHGHSDERSVMSMCVESIAKKKYELERELSLSLIDRDRTNDIKKMELNEIAKFSGVRLFYQTFIIIPGQFLPFDANVIS